MVANRSTRPLDLSAHSRALKVRFGIGPPRGPSGEGVRLERGRSRVRIPLATRFFSEASHTSDLKIGTPVATLLGAWLYRVNAEAGRPGVSIL